MIKKTKYWQVPEVHFNSIQGKKKEKHGQQQKKMMRYNELRPTVSYLLRKIG